jgi:type IV secretory pathway TrbD component
MTEENIQGYGIPIHRSLVKPLFWLGVPRNLLLSEFFAGLVGGLLFKTFTIPVLMLVVHLICKYLATKDPQFHTVYIRSLYHSLYYKV